MNTLSELRSIERNNQKSKRLATILKAGKKLFLKNGIGKVEMKEIASRAKISRASLYRYFPSKKDLAIEILNRYTAEWLIPELLKNKHKIKGNGLNKVKVYSKILLEGLSESSEFYCFLSAVEHYFSFMNNAEELGNVFQSMNQQVSEIYSINDFIKEGQIDGSIRKDIDSALLSVVIMQSFFNMAKYLSTNGESLSIEYGIIESNHIIKTMLDLLICSISNSDI